MTMNNMFELAKQFQSNPMQLLSQKYNIPQNLNNPNEIIQHLLNTGQVSQAQVNRAMQMRNNPLIQQLFKK